MQAHALHCLSWLLVSECMPSIPGVDQLVDELNTKNDFAWFVQAMRMQFRRCISPDAFANKTSTAVSSACWFSAGIFIADRTSDAYPVWSVTFISMLFSVVVSLIWFREWLIWYLLQFNFGTISVLLRAVHL